MDFNSILDAIDSFVWGIPTILLIMVTGILLTIRTKGIQFRKLGLGFKSIFKSNTGKGEVSSFGALCTALSATIGTGNIVGVATAIAAGGPGALFWMWIYAFFGMAVAYMEGVLAQIFKEKKDDEFIGGLPFYGRKLLGNKVWIGVFLSILYILYAFCCNC